MTRNLAQESMRTKFVLWLAVLFVGAATPSFGQGDSDAWLIQTNGKKGSICAQTTREDLVRLYGAENVIDQAVDAGEGDTETGTVLFPHDPKRMIEILWQDRDKKRNPNRVTISGRASLWHAIHGISLGTSYSDLERLNGKPFPVSWGTDQGSVVLSWKGGMLERELKAGGRVFIWLDDVASNESATTKRERRINQIAWEFPYQVPQ